MTDEILYSVADGVAMITLNRPEKLNSMTSHTLHELLGALREADADDEVRAVLLTGSGRAFCAGQDLDDPAVSAEGADIGALLEERWNPVIRAMRAMPKPIVVAVNGVAAGAGANLALAGDIVIAAGSARFLQAFSRIGLIPDTAGTWTLQRAVGRARALGLSMLANTIDAETARSWGLIWDVAADDQLMSEAGSLATRLASGPTRAYGAIKAAIDAGTGNSIDEQLDLERDVQRDLGYSDDYREGVAAFTEKREARFQGR